MVGSVRKFLNRVSGVDGTEKSAVEAEQSESDVGEGFDSDAERAGEARGGEQSPGPGRVVATLVAIAGDLEGRVFSLKEGENRIGRSVDSEIVLASEWISRSHVRILCKAGSMRMYSVSDKRTEVNGEPTDATELADGDTIQLGRTTLRLRTVD